MIEAGAIELSGQSTFKQVHAAGGRTRSVGLIADEANTEKVWVNKKGSSEKTGFPLKAGSFVSLDIFDVSYLYVAGKTGEKVYYIIDGINE